jgi:hypothetical protein
VFVFTSNGYNTAASLDKGRQNNPHRNENEARISSMNDVCDDEFAYICEYLCVWVGGDKQQHKAAMTHTKNIEQKNGINCWSTTMDGIINE